MAFPKVAVCWRSWVLAMGRPHRIEPCIVEHAPSQFDEQFINRAHRHARFLRDFRGWAAAREHMHDESEARFGNFRASVVAIPLPIFPSHFSTLA